MCCRRPSIWLVLILALAALWVAVWYRNLPEERKLFYQNLARQVPDLPGRYMA
jgi:hypothetical protein